MGVSWSEWYDLNSTTWQSSFSGVYVIKTSSNTTVYVGQGNIGNRLDDHQDDSSIQAFKNQGLYVKHASIQDEYNRKGAEAYLQRVLNPKVGNRSNHQELVVDIP